MRSLLLSLLLTGAVAISLAKPVPGSGGNHGTASPGGNPGAGAASGPVLSPESDASSTEATVRGKAVVMRGGNAYLRSNGKEVRLSAETSLGEGLTVDHRGTVTFKDGRQAELREGQVLTPDGQIADRPLSK